jgi:hypothetical protein
VQNHSLRDLYLSDNEFEVSTIPEIFGAMAKFGRLELGGIGFTGTTYNYWLLLQLLAIATTIEIFAVIPL